MTTPVKVTKNSLNGHPMAEVREIIAETDRVLANGRAKAGRREMERRGAFFARMDASGPSPADDGIPRWQGKAYGELTNEEKHELALSDGKLFDAMRATYRPGLMATPSPRALSAQRPGGRR
jgi:hypothetical protein